MGAYVNPRGQTKEAWLEECAIEIDRDAAMGAVSIASDLGLLAHVDNGAFTAVLWVLSDGDRQAVFNETRRMVRFFVAPVALIEQVAF